MRCGTFTDLRRDLQDQLFAVLPVPPDRQGAQKKIDITNFVDLVVPVGRASDGNVVRDALQILL